MADLIELDLVVRDKGLKASISTVERLERQIIKAAKAVDQNSISQVRYNKILLSTKREYEALGLSSQKSTSTVRAFAAAQRKATAEAAKENSAFGPPIPFPETETVHSPPEIKIIDRSLDLNFD